MSINSIVRIKKEYREVRETNDGSGVSAELVGDSFTHWKGSIKGPEGTPYEGGVFVSLALTHAHCRLHDRRLAAARLAAEPPLTLVLSVGSRPASLQIVDIQIPSSYPFEPPKMRFDTKVSEGYTPAPRRDASLPCCARLGAH